MNCNFSYDSILNYYRVFHKLLELLTDRGFDINPKTKSINFPKFVSLFGSNFEKGSSLSNDKFNFQATHSINKNRKILIVFPKDDKVKINIVMESFIKIDQLNISDAIIIYTESITAFAENKFRLDSKSMQSSESKKKINFTKFSMAQILSYNPNNPLLPKYRKLDEKEKIDLFKKNKWEEKNLGKIFETDMICHYGDFKNGDVIEIIDKVGFNGQSIKWKIVEKK